MATGNSTSSGQRMTIMTLLLTSSGQEWQFHMSTDNLVVKNESYTWLLTSSGQEWQFHIATDI